MPPTIALIMMMVEVNRIVCLGVIHINITRGLIFCHVVKIIHIDHGIQDMTWGSHWWQGAIPSLITILVMNNIPVRSGITLVL